MSNTCDNRFTMGAAALYEFLIDFMSPEENACFDMKKFKEESGFETVGTNSLFAFEYNDHIVKSFLSKPELHDNEVHLAFESGQPLALHALAYIAKRYNTRLEYVYAEVGMELSAHIVFNADGSLHSNAPISLFEALVERMGFDEEYAAELYIFDTANYLNQVTYPAGRKSVTKSYLLTDVPCGMSLEHIQQVGHIAYEASKRHLETVGIDYFLSVFNPKEIEAETSRPVRLSENGVKQISHIQSVDIIKTSDIIGFDVFSYPETIDLIKELIEYDVEENGNGSYQDTIDHIESNATQVMKMVLLSVIDKMQESEA